MRFAGDYALGVAVHSPGVRIDDFHTIQSPTARQAINRRARTRADELSVDETHTSITHREYLADARYTIAIFQLSDTPIVTVGVVVDALGHPEFPLYAGRRGCTLGRIAARAVEGSLEAVLPDATHWDRRITAPWRPSLVRERRDMLAGNRKFTIRQEAVR
jgi:hypothetical protein